MSLGAGCLRLALVLAFLTAVFFWCGWKSLEGWHSQRAIAQVEYEMDRGLSSLAARHLTELLARYPGSDEARFLLGACEKARGRPQAAAQAWAKIAPDSPFGFRALENRVELELADGRLTAAEQLIARARGGPQFAGQHPSILLGPIYCREGRIKEALRLIESLWEAHKKSGEAGSETAINQLRLYIKLRSNPVTDETIRAILDQAGRIAPDDDRIWLWKATLATRTKAYDEAARWLDRCLERHPEDVAVWDARLHWAMATHRAPLARDALMHLPTAEFSSAEVEKLAAWFAAEQGDDGAEQSSLERLIATDPTDFAAFDRLIELCEKSGQSEAAATLRHRKQDVARLEARYQKLFARHQPRRDAAEMARLAEQLGRRFEARAFLMIAPGA
jgi:enediyne biosynthesis protein E4